MSKRISPTLSVDVHEGNNVVCCGGCGTPLAASSEHWKDRVSVKRSSVSELAGWSDAVHERLELREFSCPACGQLLDSEAALPEDPFLYDVVHV